MKKHRTLIIKALLGWWLLCLAGPCLALPVYQSLDHGASAVSVMKMDAAGHHRGCDADTTVCDGKTFPAAFFLLLAAALPLLLWSGIGRSPALLFRAFLPFRVRATGPPVYLLSQRFLE